MKYINQNQNICCDDVMQCILNLNNLDIEVYKTLKEKGEKRADQLAQYIGKERSTVYRSLQKLTCAGLCKKKTKTLTKGGYYHTYICNNKKTTKKQLEKCIDNWYLKMKNTLKEF